MSCAIIAMMDYKGYRGIAEWDNGNLHGHVLGTRDRITFGAKTREDLRREFENSVDAYLKFCQAINRKPAKPCPED